ncbi:MAG: LytTR family DNA-binding domain-containing protein [Bacteroidota bacterium]
MNCIIIDDEPLAIDVIESYCNAIDSLVVVKTFTNALEAIDFLGSNKVDLVFSDIEMPQISGVEFIKSLEGNRPYFIFTTAYPQYALEGFELNAIDYLVKPIPFPRFIKAINRVKDLMKLNQEQLNYNISSASGESPIQDEFIFVKSEYENLNLKLNEIKFIQGLKDYLKIHIADRSPVLTLMNFSQMQSKLPDHSFIRVHRSFIVNVNMISSVQKSKIIIDDIRIPIGDSYKDMVYDRLGI